MSASLPPLPAGAFADFLLNRPGGASLALADELVDRFPTILRFDVFLGIALAWTIRDADLVASFIEIRDLRRQLEGACHEIETLQRQPEQRSAA